MTKVSFFKILKKDTPIKLIYFVEDPNFGDMLNVDLFSKYTNKTVINTDKNKADIVAIGSLLHVLLNKKNKNLKNKKPLIVYGTGFIEKNRLNDFFIRPLDVRAVRGFRTLDRLRKCENVAISTNVAVGDPALLIPKIFDVSNIKKKYKLGIIPHYLDRDNPLLQKIRIKNSVIIDVSENTYDFVKKVAECESIISSAMHGLICADSLLIPNIRMILSDKITGGDYKFDDYYSAFGIKRHNKVDLNLQEFTEKDLEFTINNYKLDKNKLTEIQKNLLSQFPYDLNTCTLKECQDFTDKPVKENKLSFGFKKQLVRELFKNHKKTNLLQYWFYRLKGKI